MEQFLNACYVSALVALSPWIAYKALRTGKYRAGWAEKALGLAPRRQAGRPCVWFHAVRVGEVLALRPVVKLLAERQPAWEIVVSTTTNTGLEIARAHLSSWTSFYFPLDFTWAVERAMDRMRPDVIALVELELWPNFISAARRRGIRLAVINGRMSPRSYRGYQKVKRLASTMISSLDAVGAQTSEYAERLLDLGASPEQIVVTGSVKYDGVVTQRDNPRTAALRELFDVRPEERVFVAGSTQEPEEAIILDVYEALAERHAGLRLIVVPRHKERFEEVARLLESRKVEFVRRSELGGMWRAGSNRNESTAPDSGPARGPGRDALRPVILVDTLGELSAVGGLADIAFGGGSLGDRGGQNMIEPAGYGAAVVFGPNTWNFADTVDQLISREGALVVRDKTELVAAVDGLLRDASRGGGLGTE